MTISRRALVSLIASSTVSGALLSGYRHGAKAATGKTIAYSQAELINDWRVTNQKDMERRIKEAGYRFISVSADQDASKQLSDIENLLAQSPDLLVVSPVESVALSPAVGMANDARVPLIVIDRTLNVKPGTGMYKAEITQSHYQSGKLLALKTIELLTKKHGAPKGSIVHVQGMAGASPVIDANRGWNETLVAYPSVKTVATADAGFTKEGGIRVMQDFLQRFPAGSIDVVRTDYSDMTLGAIDAIKNVKRTELLGFLVGEGGSDVAIKAVVAGDIARETQTPPYFGQLVVANAAKILAGQPVALHQDVPIKVFDADKPAEAKAYLASIQSAGLRF